MEQAIEILYQDRRVLVAVKPQGVLSTDGPGGMPELLRVQLNEPEGCVRTVHRLDQVTGGVMVFARSREAARRLSAQVREKQLEKRYLAVVHGLPPAEGALRDLLFREKSSHRTLVVPTPGPGVQEALLRYRVLDAKQDCSLVTVTLDTGRTHQIRVQFASRGYPLVGDQKYGDPMEPGPLGLWACHLGFFHPETGTWMEFSAPPPANEPWNMFSPLERFL